MDLHLLDASPDGAERAAVDAVLGPPRSGWEGGGRTQGDGHASVGGAEARSRRDLLLPALHAVQDRVGWISRGALNYICRRLTIPPAEAYGVASFYALFSLEPRPPAVAHVCDDIACMSAGGRELIDELEATVGAAGALGADGRSTWQRSPCLGLCDRAPAVLCVSAGERPSAMAIAPAAALAVVDALSTGSMPPTRATCVPWAGPVSLLRRIGKVDPESLDDYRAHGGYAALRTAVGLGPVGVVREVKDAKLLGRGGAAFPTGVKWEAVAGQPVRPHYFVCNADESEPGTFKDRVLMEEDPFAVVEALTIAGYATGCERGYVYVRGEYPLARQRLERAVAQARARGFLGDDVMGEGFRFDVEVRRGAGAYIAGEETAMFNSIEGFRAEPRNKPPFPVERGLFGKPTGINNVETLLSVLEILRIGGAAYAEIGTPESTGTRLFCLAGCVARPGLYEVPFGTTLGEVIALAGGVRDGRPLQAVLLGGAAGSFVRPDRLDLPLTFEATREAGATLGSGVVMLFDESVDLRAVLLRIAAFFRDESCGQCVPCRVGTARQEELLHRLVRTQTIGSMDDELTLFADIARAMRDASICGLGQTAASAIESAIRELGMFAAGGAG